MAIGNINNSSGIGYTQMTGLGLTSATQDQVKLSAAVSESMSEDILQALAEFRAEGNLRPTSEQMAAKLSATGAAARQAQINEVEHLIYGFQNLLTTAMSANGQDETNTTSTTWVVAGAAGSTDLATRTKYFGSALGANQWGPLAALHSYLPTLNQSLPALYTGSGSQNSGHTNAQLQFIITSLQTKLSELQSQSNTSTTPDAGGLSAQEWLASAMGVTNLRDSYSLQQWGEMAQQLQVEAAKKKSQLSIGNGGGIQQVNGQYFVNGEMMSLSQVNFCVRANQYQLIDQQIADQMNAVQQNNEKAKKANALLAAFKSSGTYTNLANEQTGTEAASDLFFNQNGGIVHLFLKENYPTPPAHTYQNYHYVINSWNSDEPLLSRVKETMSLIKAAAPDFYSKYITDSNGGPPYNATGNVTYSDWDAAKTAISTYLSQNSTDNQVAQQRLESLNNTRQSILAGMSAFTQGQSQLTDRIGGNL